MTVASGNGTAESSISGQLKSDGNLNESKPADFGAAAPSAGELAANAPTPTFDRLVAGHGAAENYSTTQSKSVQFASAAPQSSAFGLQNNFKNMVAQNKVLVVLAIFQVQQNGNAIRVVDQDGSVYDGLLQPEIAVAQRTSASAETLAPPSAMPTQAGQDKTIAGRDKSKIEPQAAQNYFFRVSGMNQTLKQNVVFAGTLLGKFQHDNELATNIQWRRWFWRKPVAIIAHEPIAVVEFAHSRNRGDCRYEQHRN